MKKYTLDKVMSISGAARTLYVAFINAHERGVNFCLSLHYVSGEKEPVACSPFNGPKEQFKERSFVRSQGRDLTGNIGLWPKPLVRALVTIPGLVSETAAKAGGKR